MKTLITTTITFLLLIASTSAQVIPLDTANWDFTGDYLLEQYQGKQAVYTKGGIMKLKNQKFLNGTIEFDFYLKDARGFPGIYFRAVDSDSEHFYLRPHQDGNPDANQAIPVVKGITPWQLYFGPRYSFPYNYTYDDWTHVKIVVNGKKAQVFLDNAEKPNLSWDLTLPIREGEIYFRGGLNKAIHIADIKVDANATELIDFKPIEREPLEGLIPEWEISDKFDEKRLSNLDSLGVLIEQRKWQGKVKVEEGTAANISRIQERYDDAPGNTVFARYTFDSDSDQTKLFEFGYSDRVVVLLNGSPIYKGTNRFRSRDYRYLGTIGLFDAVYLNLRKGENTLHLAVSEDFGGWLVTGRLVD